MCDTSAIKKIVAGEIGPVVTAIEYITRAVEDIKTKTENLPCGSIHEKQIRASVVLENIEKNIATDRKDIDLLYGMVRTLETNVATLLEQNKGQDKISARTWAIIMVAITVAFNIAGYLMKQ